jgi:hypothetical protein
MPRGDNPRRELERRILELILEYPERLDEMETRNEEHCRTLASRIARLVEEEIRRREAAR